MSKNDLPSVRFTHRPARAFSLLEALVASAILAASVLAVISAMGAAQSIAFDGQKRVLAAMTANDLMGELHTLPYAELKTHEPINQPLGLLSSIDESAYPATFWALSRSATFTLTTKPAPVTGQTISGMDVIVSVRDSGAELCRLESFVPEPAGGG